MTIKSSDSGKDQPVERLIDLQGLPAKKSHFLLGPRQTGKLPAWRKTKKRKPLASSKYYFFDVGVVAALQERRFRRGTPEFGEALETYLMHELISYSDYVSQDSISYWRSTTGFEVDFIIGDHTAIEVKAKENVSLQELKPLRALAEEKRLKRYLCVSLEPRARNVEGVWVLPIGEFLEALWDGEYV